MSASTKRSFRSTVALPLLAVGLPLVSTLTACGSNDASSPASQSSLTTVATSAASAGSDGSGTSTSSTSVTTTTATTTATATVSNTTTGPASSNGTHATSPSASAASHGAGNGSTINVRDLDYVSFASPSGHIQCSYVIDGGGEVSCQVEGAKWTPKTSTNCQQAQGDEASLPGTGRGELACHTSTELGSAIVGSEKTSWTSRHAGTTGTWNGRTVAVLPYGTTMLLGNLLSCTSHASGMTCSNEAGHSFTVARGDYSVS